MLSRYRETNDNEWLGILLQRYTMLLFGVAMKYLKDKEQANDAVQQIFLKALIHLPTGAIQNFKGWLYILMRNHCLQLLRDKNYHASDEALQYIRTDEDSRRELLEKEYTLAQLAEAMEELNEEQQIAIRLFYLEKQSYQQIMEQTGFSFMQVKSYIQNGKRNLRLILSGKINKHL